MTLVRRETRASLCGFPFEPQRALQKHAHKHLPRPFVVLVFRGVTQDDGIPDHPPPAVLVAKVGEFVGWNVNEQSQSR